MNKQKFQPTVNLLDLLDKELKSRNASERAYSPPKTPTIWPTDASVQWQTSNGLTITEGACHRAIWYRLNKYPSTDEPVDRMYWIWNTGHWWEKECQDLSDRAGMLAGKSIRMRDESMPLTISGEIDAVNYVMELDDEGNLVPNKNRMFVIDYKSTGGSYQNTVKLMGNSRHTPFPKVENLMQLMVYLNFDRRFEFGMLIYLIRDRMERTQFEIKLVKDPVTKRTVAEVNGTVDHRYNIEEIFRRYNLICHYYTVSDLPPRDYDHEYSDHKVELLYEEKLIPKSKYEKHHKGDKQGDWRCSYCPFQSQCLQDGE